MKRSQRFSGCLNLPRQRQPENRFASKPTFRQAPALAIVSAISWRLAATPTLCSPSIAALARIAHPKGSLKRSLAWAQTY
ncbi:hypothetical protein [Kingella oralis]|uniref:hypothetical protein n=1 Tax=Kingella oralis TaxID=505 RepID=UPI0034E444E5